MSWRTEQNGFIKTWAQDVRNSYKVRLKYVLVPKGVQTDIRFIDTPYRFQSYQEAREYAKELFPCYSYAVEGSPDQPNFNETQFVQRTTKEELQNTKYYDVYGVKRSYMKEPLDSREMNEQVVTTRTTKKSVPLTKLTVEEQIDQKLTDIEILRLKLNEKESELTQMKNSITSNNSKRNTLGSRNSSTNNSKKTITNDLPPPYTNSKSSNSTNSTNTTKTELPPPYTNSKSNKKMNVTSRNTSTSNSKKTNVKSTKNSPPPYDSQK